MKSTSSYNSTTNQQIKSDLVQREVLVNVSELMSHLLKQEPGEYEDELYLVSSQPDYESAAEDAGWHEDDNGDWRHEDDEEDSDDYYPSAEEVCSGEDIDHNYHEALEFWAITPYFGEKLKEQGEMVEEIFGLTVWGRCTSGQAILLDHCVSKVAEDIGILEGQPNDWSKYKR